MGDLEQYEAFFRVLANQTRLRILNALAKDKKTVTQLCKELKLEQSLVSHNLARLRCCGFIGCEQNGKTKIYRQNPETMKLLFKIKKHMSEYKKCVMLLKEDGKVG